MLAVTARAVTVYWLVVPAVGVIVAAEVVDALRPCTDPLMVTTPGAAVEPMVIVVVEPDKPAVPMLTVLVLPEVVAPLESVSVVLAVDVPNELFAPVAVILPPE